MAISPRGYMYLPGDKSRAFKVMTTIKLRSTPLIERLDQKQAELSLDTRTNLVEVLLRKGLDFLDSYGYDSLLRIPNLSDINEDKRMDSPR